MPDIDGRLTPEERKGIEARLAGKMNACPICSSRNWALSDMVVTRLPLEQAEDYQPGTRCFLK